MDITESMGESTGIILFCVYTEYCTYMVKLLKRVLQFQFGDKQINRKRLEDIPLR